MSDRQKRSILIKYLSSVWWMQGNVEKLSASMYRAANAHHWFSVGYSFPGFGYLGIEEPTFTSHMTQYLKDQINSTNLTDVVNTLMTAGALPNLIRDQFKISTVFTQDQNVKACVASCRSDLLVLPNWVETVQFLDTEQTMSRHDFILYIQTIKTKDTTP